MNPDRSVGVKLKSDVARDVSHGSWRFHGDLVGQTFLDFMFTDESKLIVNFSAEIRHALRPSVNVVAQLVHFWKTFYWQTRSYRWTQYTVFLEVFPSDRVAMRAGYLLRPTAFVSSEEFRFRENELEIGGSYRFNSRLSVEGSANSGFVRYRDNVAWGLDGDSGPVPLEQTQKDRFRRGSVHLRYRGRVIVGFQLGLESVTSNSVTGRFDLASIRAYFSGRWGKRNFYHLVLQRVNKDYKYPRVTGFAGYRDPEERIQNRTYLQLERILDKDVMGFIQISFMENETVLNQQYYDKTMVEAGVKYAF
ncbi:MAG: hypothetical protein ACE5GH_06980 [Fidelibacterota bacterium]